MREWGGYEVRCVYELEVVCEVGEYGRYWKGWAGVLGGIRAC
jgi:hypothetical protein